MASNFPNGFLNGVVIRGVPVQQLYPGKVFWVNNSAVLAEGSVSGSDSNSGSYLAPFSTIDYAIGQCTASRGDIICVMPGHAENMATAAQIDLDVAGVAIVGLGKGELRPILTSITNTAARFAISAANCAIHNLVFKCNIASQANPVLVTATNVSIVDCEFRDGSASGLNAITFGAADNDSDRFLVQGCKFYQPGGNNDHSIEILFDMVQGRILDCESTGDFDEGVIAIPAGGNACLDLQIKRCTLRNTQTNIAAISINGTSCTGIIQDCLLVTDTQASALDNGSLATDNVRWADETDQVTAASSVIAPLDTTTNFLGVDSANNSASTSTVVANVDGTVLERLEALMDPLGGYDPMLGFRVTKTSNLADGGGTDNLFTVTGRCLITHLSGEVTTVVATTTTMKLRDTTNSNDLCAATTITTDAVGTMYALTPITANVLNGTGATPVIGSVPNITGAGLSPIAIVGDSQAALTISHVLDAAGTGAVAWILYYKPIASGATIVAAA